MRSLEEARRAVLRAILENGGTVTALGAQEIFRIAGLVEEPQSGQAPAPGQGPDSEAPRSGSTERGPFADSASTLCSLETPSGRREDTLATPPVGESYRLPSGRSNSK